MSSSDKSSSIAVRRRAKRGDGQNNPRKRPSRSLRANTPEELPTSAATMSATRDTSHRNASLDRDTNRPPQRADTDASPRTSPRSGSASPRDRQMAGPNFEMPAPNWDGLRQALERNGQATAALFHQTLDVVERQNRELAGLERRISELSSRLKSLGNR